MLKYLLVVFLSFSFWTLVRRNRAPRYGFPDRQRLHQHPHFTCVLPWRCHRKRSQALASDEQLKYLSTAKTLFIDGTFKMVCKPFVQLLSIHFFANLEIHILGLCCTVCLLMSVCSPDYVVVVWSGIFWVFFWSASSSRIFSTHIQA
jgi:hypothetical protein